MSDNKCAVCGQFSGKGHHCPRANTPDTSTPVTPEIAPFPPEIVMERVARARTHAAETETALTAAQAQVEALTAEKKKADFDVLGWEYAARQTVIASETLPDGTLHQTFGDGTEMWTKDDHLHNEHGPALIQPDWYDGTRTAWHLNGRMHRVDGPALINTSTKDPREEWRYEGELHRDGGPAVIRGDGTQEWWRHGELHRTDGPAIITGTGHKSWYRDGVNYQPGTIPSPHARQNAHRTPKRPSPFARLRARLTSTLRRLPLINRSGN